MKKTAGIKIEDIVFWILIALAIAIVVWKLFGSPSDVATLMSFALFIVGSEILLWKALFSIEKKTACGFMKIKYETQSMKKEINSNLNQLNSKLISIENMLKNKK